jgi:hypothetical protein
MTIDGPHAATRDTAVTSTDVARSDSDCDGRMSVRYSARSGIARRPNNCISLVQRRQATGGRGAAGGGLSQVCPERSSLCTKTQARLLCHASRSWPQPWIDLFAMIVPMDNGRSLSRSRDLPDPQRPLAIGSDRHGSNPEITPIKLLIANDEDRPAPATITDPAAARTRGVARLAPKGAGRSSYPSCSIPRPPPCA